MHRVLRFPVSRCRSSPVATVQFGRILSSKQFDPFVWPGASDPPAGTLYNPRLAYIHAVTGTAVSCTCSCQETRHEGRFKATIGPTQGDERGCVFKHSRLSLFF